MIPGVTKVRRGSLLRRYSTYFLLLLCVAVLTSGGLSAYFSYRDTRLLIEALQQEKSRSAAERIEQFLQMLRSQLQTASMAGGGEVNGLQHRHLELVKLLRIVPAVSDAAWLDRGGHERVRVSRLARDAIGTGVDRSADRAVAAALAGNMAFGELRFRRETEPHVEIAVPGLRADEGLITAEINLKFVSDVIAGLEIGEMGQAYVVDAEGRLIAHSDSSPALRRTNLSNHPQVRAALSEDGGWPGARTLVTESNPRMIASHAAVVGPGWHVIVEQPFRVAFASVFDTLLRTVFLLVAGIIGAAGAGLLLARRMTAPIRSLESGVRRIGEGYLEERVEIRSGDELEELADQFNRMAQRLRDSYAGLEQKVEDRTRELQEANRAKTRFLAAASHDLRQPVHALGLFVAQMEAAKNPQEMRALVGRVSASSAVIAELIEALLDISKLDAGTVNVQPADFALQMLFDRMEQAFALPSSEKGLRLRIRPTRFRVRTDPLLLERILLNLCSNAVRYTAKGGVILTARRRGSAARVEVWDTGIGIPVAERERIFEEFYQLSDVHDAGAKGIGLGLAIVHRLATLLGLSVTLRSVPGRGSVFAVDLPISTDTGSKEPVAAFQGAGVLQGFPVLLVDDDLSARMAAEGLLAQWGCVVRVETDGAGVFERWNSALPPRLIICDYHLRDELGTELVARLRQHAGQDIPAVIVSADAGPELREETMRSGLHLLHKPLNAARLRALVAHVAGTGSLG